MNRRLAASLLWLLGVVSMGFGFWNIFFAFDFDTGSMEVVTGMLCLIALQIFFPDQLPTWPAPRDPPNA